MVKKTEEGDAISVKRTRGGSVSSKKPVAKKGNSRRKIVDPMLINSAKAEEDNIVLDGALADLEIAQERMDSSDFVPEDVQPEEKEAPAPSKDEVLEDIWGAFEEPEGKKAKKEKKSVDREEKKAKKAEKKAGRRDEKGRKLKKNGKPKMRLWKKIAILLLIALLGALGYIGWYLYTALDKTTSVFQGNVMDIFNPEPLAQDENGWTNVLVFGTSEDNTEHKGAMLADSILVVSFNQEKKVARTFSIPRDLWVNYTVTGEEQMYCSVGYKGKINAEYMCAMAAFDDDKDKASRYFARKVSEVTGLNIQYYVAVDWTVLRTVVDTLGGIDVDVWATDPRGIYDICQFNLKLDKGMNYNLDGNTVLKLARARNAMGGYGLANSNFDREKNQQRIINSIKNKALDVGILTDPNKVFTIIDSLGQNVKTNISMSEVRTVLDLGLELKGDIESIETQQIFSTGRFHEQSIVRPAGSNLNAEWTLYDYSGIREYLKEQLKDAITEEEKTEDGEEAEAAETSEAE